MALVLKKLAPPTLWEEFAQFVAAKEAGTFREAATVLNYANEEGLGLELYAPSLRLMVSLAEMLLIFGRHHWGEPDHLFERSKRDQMSPAKNAPAWLEDFLQNPFPSSDVKREARKVGFSEATIKRAASKLKVLVREADFPRRTYWLPPVGSQSDQDKSVEPTDDTTATEEG